MNLPSTTFGFLLHFVRQQWFKFLILLLTSMAWATNDAFFPYFLKLIVNTLQNYQGDPTEVYQPLKWILGLLVGFWIVNELTQRLQGIVSIYTLPRFRANIREEVFDYVKSHSQEYFSTNFAGSIAKKTADLPDSCQMIVEIVIFQFITAFTGAALVITMMWLTSPIFALILFIWLCTHLSLTVLFLVLGNHTWKIHSDAVSTLSGKIIDVFTNMSTVRLFARGKYEAKYLRRFQNDEISKAHSAMWTLEITRIGLGLSGLFLIFGMIFTLLYGWAHHWVSIGDFTQIGMQTFWLLGWIWYVSFQMTFFARQIGTIRNALELIQEKHAIIDKPKAEALQVSKGKISFENVCFAYNKYRPVFKNLNLIIPAGERVGLVGFSGSGKTTLVNLIMRFYDLQTGCILIDHQNIAEVKQESLRSQIAMIPQDPSLFHRSLIENIRYGRLEASDEEVVRASKLAHCHEFIEKLDEGYKSLVGERGIKLSGGQRQRISIARAILKNAPILILDEATSSLDSVTEKLIQDSLDHLMKGRTTLVIAHRLSTLANMDRILVFSKGKVVEEGTQEALLKAKGYFAALWNMQTDGFLPEEDQ